MKIVRVRPVALTAPYVFPRTPADDPENRNRNCVWVRVETDEGVTGWGEAYSGCFATEVTIAALKKLGRSLIGQDAMEPGAVLREVRFRNFYWGMRGIGAQSISAVEAALWDIYGQAQGKPLWQMLGDGKPRPVLLYASAGVSFLSPREILEETKLHASQGYQAYKIRCGGDIYHPREELSIDVERVAAAREGLGAQPLLFVDVAVPQRPRTWEKGRAEAYMQALHPYKVRFIEEPAMTYDVKRYRELQTLNLIPTAGGESFCCPEEFEPFFDAGALGVAQPDAAVVGGPASCVEVEKRAREFGVPVVLHCWCAGVGIAQNLHAAASVEGVLAMEGPQAIHPPATEPLKEIWEFKDGYLLPPSRPGLGVAISEEFLARYAYQPSCERDY